MANLLTASQTARLLETSTSTVRRLALAGELAWVRLHPSGQRRYRREDVEQLLERSRGREPASV